MHARVVAVLFKVHLMGWGKKCVFVSVLLRPLFLFYFLVLVTVYLP